MLLGVGKVHGEGIEEEKQQEKINHLSSEQQRGHRYGRSYRRQPAVHLEDPRRLIFAPMYIPRISFVYCPNLGYMFV